MAHSLRPLTCSELWELLIMRAGRHDREQHVREVRRETDATANRAAAEMDHANELLHDFDATGVSHRIAREVLDKLIPSIRE